MQNAPGQKALGALRSRIRNWTQLYLRNSVPRNYIVVIHLA